jgi:hypothetical protein
MADRDLPRNYRAVTCRDDEVLGGLMGLRA